MMSMEDANLFIDEKDSENNLPLWATAVSYKDISFSLCGMCTK